MKARTSIVITSLISCVFCTAITSHALLYEFNRDLSNTIPGVSKTWLTAEFTDTAQLINGNTTSGVLLKLSAPGLNSITGPVFVSNWFFNNTLENSLNSLKYVSVLNGTALTDFLVQVNSLNAGNGATYDINVQFQQSNNNSGRFEPNNTADIFMYGVAGLNAESFKAESAINGKGKSKDNNKQYFAEAHIQGISTDTGSSSAWVVPGSGSGHPGSGPAPVPEPGSLVLFGVGLLGLAIYAKRHMNHR